MSIYLSLESSVKDICKNSQEVMIYGFAHCNYDVIKNRLKYSSQSPFKKIYDYKCGYPFIEENTLEKSDLYKIHYDIDLGNTSIKQYKIALVDIVFENFKRKKMGKKLIPILFCIDRDHNRFPLTPENLTSKQLFVNSIKTHKELRRAYKLCEEFKNEEIRVIARETFKFVKVKANLGLELVSPPWHHKNWSDLWKERLEKRTTPPLGKKMFWREQLKVLLSGNLGKSKL